jgi:hypothetical protein
LEECEEEREEEWALMQEPALAPAPRHFERAKDGPCNAKIVYFYSLLLYMLTKLAIGTHGSWLIASSWLYYCHCSNNKEVVQELCQFARFRRGKIV